MWGERANTVQIIHYMAQVIFEPGQSIFKVHFVANQLIVAIFLPELHLSWF